ncbi:HepT-like ribonuclease domain-containing protein [Virgibacillus sp. FSP13]
MMIHGYFSIKYRIVWDVVQNKIPTLVLITVILWVGAMISSGILQSILFGVATILSIIALPAVGL